MGQLTQTAFAVGGSISAVASFAVILTFIIFNKDMGKKFFVQIVFNRVYAFFCTRPQFYVLVKNSRDRPFFLFFVHVLKHVFSIEHVTENGFHAIQ